MNLVMIDHLSSLEELWQYTTKINEKYFPQNMLMPIFGGGQTVNPKVMFLFINPTVKNISSNPSWNGPRWPFLGTKHIWRIFHRAEMFDEQLLQQIETSKSWSVEFAQEVYDYLAKRGFYFTNIVKWTGHNADLPDTEKTKLFLPILQREIEIVKPSYIVTFGLIPFTHLMGQKIKLEDYYRKVMQTGRLITYSSLVNSTSFSVIPCYFPVGRGDPKRAVDILKLVSQI
jgi:uracil-DNA glycosylase